MVTYSLDPIADNCYPDTTVLINKANICKGNTKMMKIYYSDIRGIDASQAMYPPLGNARGSALGTSLLAVAYEDCAAGRLPKILRLFGGKPVFANMPGLHFSISHSRTHVLCAISSHPIGADTLDHRAVRPETIARLAMPEELSCFTIHELWTLRESFFKLTGEGDLRTMRFIRENGVIKGPRGDVFFKLYKDIENSSVAASSFSDCFPDELTEIPVQRLLK